MQKQPSLSAECAAAIGIAHVLQPFSVGRLQRQGIALLRRRIRRAELGFQALLRRRRVWVNVGPQVSSGVAYSLPPR
jgi:hypothetical protein